RVLALPPRGRERSCLTICLLRISFRLSRARFFAAARKLVAADYFRSALARIGCVAFPSGACVPRKIRPHRDPALRPGRDPNGGVMGGVPIKLSSRVESDRA